MIVIDFFKDHPSNSRSFHYMKSILFLSFLFLMSCTFPAPPAGRQNLPSSAPPNFNGAPVVGSNGALVDSDGALVDSDGAPVVGPNGAPVGPNGSPIAGPNSANPASERSNEIPYELIPDVMTALTCSQNINFGLGGYTLSLGAYSKGLQLSESFKRVHNIRSSSGEKDRIMQILNQSPLRNARAEFSIRDKSNPNILHTADEQPLRAEFPIFYTQFIVDQLSSLRQVLSTRPVGNSRYNSFPFRARLNLNSSDFVRHIAPNLAQQVGNLLLTVLYTLPQSERQGFIPIYDSSRRPYGKTYTVNFKSHRNIDYLENVYEENLRDSTRGKNWECPSDLRFMVHRNGSSSDSVFNRDAEGQYSHIVPIDKLDLEGYCDLNQNPLTRRQRDFLAFEFGESESQWPFRVGAVVVHRDGRYRDENSVCIVIPSRSGSCYAAGFYRVEFDPEERLDDCERLENISGDNYESETSALYKVCPAFLSMCYRRE